MFALPSAEITSKNDFVVSFFRVASGAGGLFLLCLVSLNPSHRNSQGLLFPFYSPSAQFNKYTSGSFPGIVWLNEIVLGTSKTRMFIFLR